MTNQGIKTAINNQYGNIVDDVDFTSNGESFYLYGKVKNYKKIRKAVLDHVFAGMKLLSVDYPGKTPFSGDRVSILLSFKNK